MPDRLGTDTIREAVGLFTSADMLQGAIDDLMLSGFDRSELSLLAPERTVAEKLGHKYRKIDELEDDAIAPRRCYISTESLGSAEGGLVSALLYVGAVATAGAVVASGGTLAAVITGAALAGGVGGAIGSALARIIGDQHARHLAEHLDHGGLLLWVRTWDPAREALATQILKRHSGRDVHIHALPISP
jgi:hypothetical protein